jgi:murein DD-endopeptidase MepM/ murein hydrolase activator NlpD
MQLILVGGPVGRILKIHFSITKLIGYLFFFSAFVLIIANFAIYLKGFTNEAEDISNLKIKSMNSSDYVRLINEIQVRLSENNKRIQDLELVNKNIIKLTIPEILIEANPSLKNRLNTPLKKDASIGGPLFKMKDLSEYEKFNSLNEYVNLLSQSNKDLAEKYETWKAEMQWLLTKPIAYPIKESFQLSSGFGLRFDPFEKVRSFHSGLDFSAPVGTSIYSTATGVVKKTEWFGPYGNTIEIDHGNGLMTRYGHVSKILVKKGEEVQQGQLIAQVGNTGRSTGPHLHYEILKNNQFQNPENMLLAIHQ